MEDEPERTSTRTYCIIFGAAYLATFGVMALAGFLLTLRGIAKADRAARFGLSALLAVVGVPLLVYLGAVVMLCMRGHKGGVVMGLLSVLLAAPFMPVRMLFQAANVHGFDSSVLYIAEVFVYLCLFAVAVLALEHRPESDEAEQQHE
jgi:hypothetical protein